MIFVITTNSFLSHNVAGNIWKIAREIKLTAKQCAKIQIIKIFMNINRIINKFIISKYVKRENKPG